MRQTIKLGFLFFLFIKVTACSSDKTEKNSQPDYFKKQQQFLIDKTEHLLSSVLEKNDLGCVNEVTRYNKIFLEL